MHNYNNRRVLLTGAAGGLGAPLAKMLERAGAEVIALVRSEPDGGIPGAPKARIIMVDLEDFTELESVVNAEIAANGPIDTLINNAAIYPKARVTGLEHQELERVLKVNIIAPAILTKCCAEGMKTKHFGRVINISSIQFDLAFEELSAYVASKGALIGITRTMARDLGPYGITVNAVAPGAFKTDAEKIHTDPEAYSQFVLDQQALKRRGTPEDFANLVLFLGSEQAGFITGQNIRVDGGWVTS
ncbi:MAG: SDR family oxidoreductase [Rhizobiales bacterium]|nr:SDR family oxidoreductase [Hyphomicrobiales bacterium]NRB15825.1 SDR family oxidoreductase [Hyphomicrobiales bacterium]